MSSIRKGPDRAFAAGLLIYVFSFFLAAVGPEPIPGYSCAVAALVLPVTEPQNPAQPSDWLRRLAVRFVVIKVSGLINVVFVLATISGLAVRLEGWFKPLRILVLLMMPFCWVAFYTEALYPREGYLLWTLGIILVLFSPKRY